MPLSDIQVRNLKPRDKAYKVSDFEGLFVLVKANGSKLWQFKYRLFGKERLLSIGVYAQGKLTGVEADASVVHEAVKLLKNEKIRADFDVYLKKFLMSMDIILPHEAAHAFRVPAKRLLKTVMRSGVCDSIETALNPALAKISHFRN